MKEFITGMMIRLFAGGATCTVALIISGNGAKREIVRLCCACLMIILVLTPLKGASLDLSDVLEPARGAERQIQSSLEDARQMQLAEIEAALEGYIVGQAAAQGIDCGVQVKCQAADSGEAYIAQVVIYASLDTLPYELEAKIAGDLGIGADKILLQNGGS